jgi:hypothetical protein
VFLRAGEIRRVVATGSTYDVRFVAIQRRSPPPTRIGEAFLACLRRTHETVIPADRSD